MSARCPATAAVRAGIDCDSAYGAVTPPIVLSSNFSFAGFEQKRKYDYTRSGNPTRDQLGEALAELEGGAGGVVTNTGMSAITLVLEALLQPGDRLVVTHDCYGGSWRLFDALARKGRFELVLANLADPQALAAALAKPTRLVWIETPSNPLLRITDLREVILNAHAAGALALVDNTFLSPALQRPIEFGADLVLHSTTKYINGHSDVVGGAVVARDPALHESLVWWANALGLTGSPFDSFLTLRGLRTLDARLRVHQENAVALAERLQRHPAVAAVHYPGLATHPGHALAARQQRGFGAMISFELAGGVPAVRAFVEGLRHFTLAESLGGVESLVAHPATMTHAAMSADARRVAGIGEGLLRLSVGIEALEDLEADIGSGLQRAVRVAAGTGEVVR
jgi:cystathionine gamma-synthase